MSNLVNIDVTALSNEDLAVFEKELQARRLMKLEDIVKKQDMKFEIIEKENENTKKEVSFLSENMIGDSRAIRIIHTAGTKKVTDALGGKNSEAYKKLGKKTFINFWAYYKHKMQVPTYKDTPKAKYNEALEFIDSWNPKSELQQEIDELNNGSQLTLAL